MGAVYQSLFWLVKGVFLVQSLLQSVPVTKQLSLRFPLSITTATRISSGYGYRVHPVQGKFKKHEGIDITAPYGAEVYAASNGVVLKSRYEKGYGNVIVVQHANQVKTLYAHLAGRMVYEGTYIQKGAVIGTVGATGVATGPHLHYEIWIRNKKVDPFLFWKMLKARRSERTDTK